MILQVHKKVTAIKLCLWFYQLWLIIHVVWKWNNWNSWCKIISMSLVYIFKKKIVSFFEISVSRGIARLFKKVQNEGAARRAQGGWPRLKMAALHRPLCKVSFHGGGGGLKEGCISELTEGAQAPLSPGYVSVGKLISFGRYRVGIWATAVDSIALYIKQLDFWNMKFTFISECHSVKEVLHP